MALLAPKAQHAARNSAHPWDTAVHRAIASALFAGALCLFLACCVNTGNTDDDWTISFYLSGRIDGQGLSLFVNAIVSQIVLALNRMLPSLNWFFALEHFISFLALSSISYAVLTWWRRGAGFAVLALVTAYAMPNCIASSNYTVVAALATAAGGMILVGHMRDRTAGVPTALIGIVLVLSGLGLRFQMFALGMPFLFIAVLQTLVTRDASTSIRDRAKRLAPIGIAVALSVLMIVVDQVAWQQTGWKEWRAYNEQRTAISDYPMPDYSEIHDQLDALGISENDYFMLTSWASADVDTLTTSTLRKVAELAPRPDLSLSGLVDSLGHYAKQCLGHLTLFGPLAIAAMMLLAASRGARAAICVEFAVALAVCVYFFALGRLPDRVEEPTWLYACLASLSCLAPHGDGKLAPRAGAHAHHLARASLAAGCVMLAASVGYVAYRELPFLSVQGFAASFSQDDVSAPGVISSYVENHPDNTYVTDTGTYTRFELEYGYRYLPQPSTATRLLPLGGWGSGSPFRKAQSELVGATNPFEALLTGTSTYLISTPGMAERVLLFLQEHYDGTVTMNQVDTVMPDGTDTPVWDFSLSD